MKVVVTGASGYMGRHVVQKLLDQEHEVLGVDFVNNGLDPRAKFKKIDIFSKGEDIYQELGRPDLCIHLAWKDGFVHNSDAHMAYLSSHFEFMRKMIDSGCPRLACMGTMHEVGYWEGAIDEDTPCNPLSLYGVAKNALRQAILLYAKDKSVNIYWLRAYYILGDDMKNNSIFHKLLIADDEGKEWFPFTSGKNKYDFINVEDLAEMISLASTQDEITGIINVCSGVPVSLGERVESFIKEHDLHIRLKYGAYPDRAYDSPVIYGDNTKINQIMRNYRKRQG